MKFNNLLYKDLPVFNIVLNDETEGMSVVSIVDDPAVCQSLFCFGKEEKKTMMFVDETSEQHCLTSVAILADTPIYRIDPSGEPYYVVFQKQVIREIVEKYSKDNYNNLVSFQHNGEIVNDFVMLESYFVDKEKGIAPTQFDVPDGSWMVTYKCTNDETWEMVKNELSTGGYSIEITADIEPAPANQEIYEEPEPLYDEDEEFMNWLDELLKALEDADCEIIMESEKKKFEVERSEIASVLDGKKSVIIDGKEVWVHSLGKENGNDVAICYYPKQSKYLVLPLKDMEVFEPTNTSVGNFPELPKNIVDNDDITVQKTVNSNDIGNLLKNRVTTMVQYNDEEPNPATGYRQIAIVAWGVTTAGNECIRCYQLYGDSRSGDHRDYKLMLTKRIQSLKPMWNTEPWSRDILDDRYNWGGDDSMITVFDHITEANFA